MTTIGMQYDVLPGKEKDFENGFNAVVNALRSASGHTESRLYQDVGQPGSYLILSQWTSKQAFDAFIQSDAFRAVANWGKEQILRGRPQHKVYQDA